MTIATWPESNPTPNYPLVITPEWRTMINEMDSGSEERTAKWMYAKYNVTVTYDYLSATQMKTLYAFYMACKGAKEAFYIYDLGLLCSVSNNHVDLYCGTGDGSNLWFDIPGRSTSSHSVKVAKVVQSSEDYTINTEGGGGGGSDRIVFDAGLAPAAGNIVDCSFTGYLRMRVRFANDQQSFDMFTMNYYRTGGIQLKGLGPA
jgi:uncharacterized protein (TIGR02217 family)